jgi:hypothetical protein
MVVPMVFGLVAPAVVQGGRKVLCLALVLALRAPCWQFLVIAMLRMSGAAAFMEERLVARRVYSQGDAAACGAAALAKCGVGKNPRLLTSLSFCFSMSSPLAVPCRGEKSGRAATLPGLLLSPSATASSLANVLPWDTVSYSQALKLGLALPMLVYNAAFGLLLVKLGLAPLELVGAAAFLAPAALHFTSVAPLLLKLGKAPRASAMEVAYPITLSGLLMLGLAPLVVCMLSAVLASLPFGMLG